MRDYSDLEKLLFRGFLTSQIQVGGVPLVLKTLNQKELELVELQSFSMGDDDQWRVYTAFFLAYSTLFFNRVNVLVDRTEAVLQLADAYQDWSASVLKSLMVVVNRLNQKAAEELRLVEGYTYGHQSRRNWLSYKNTNLCDPRLTGVKGTDTLGLNSHQSLWTYFNSVEDREEQYIQEYNLAKFIVSPHAPKDVQKMDRQDRKKLKQVEKRRKALHEGREPNLVDENMQIRITDETAEELMDQMEQTVRGEKDFHDYVIEQHQRRVREAYRKRQAEMRERKKQLQEARRKRAEELIGQPLQGYTPEEVQHFLKVAERKEKQRRSEVPSDWQSMEEKERNLLRWGFIDEEDIPETRRPRPDLKEEDFDNPLIRDHYRKVASDLHMDPDED